jgi:predicted metal-dependent peptidase
MSNHEQRLRKARINLISDLPFFGTLAFKLATRFTAEVPTACTDGVTLSINPDYVAKLSDPQLTGLLVEEVGHCAMGHLWRKDQREHKIWNQACDQTLWETIQTLALSTDGRVTLSPDCHWHPQYAGLSAEEIYHHLQQSGKADENYQSPGDFSPPAQLDPSDKSDPADSPGQNPSSGDPQPQDPQDLQQEWQAAVAQAATIEKQRQMGNVPAWLSKLVADLTEPKVPWQDYIREFCHHLARDDYSFRRPNRRFLQRGFILPSLHSETLGPILCAFDTSGSIFGMDALVRDILSELQGILDLCRPVKLVLVDCDTAIHQTVEFTPGDDLRAFEPQGGGGTNFCPVFEWAETLDEPPACLIYLTDLCGRFPDEAPPYPVLWANFGRPREQAPFGTTIHLTLTQ